MSNLFLRVRVFIILLPLLVASCNLTKAAPEIEVLPKDQRPNILFILVDDLDAKLGSAAYMKNLQDLMVARGTSLDDFLITNSLCCPSRTSILRGQYTHSHQVYHNESPDGGFSKFNAVGNDESTLGVWLQSAGYRTALIGKYLNGYPFPDDRAYFPPGWSEWYSPARKNAYDGYDYVLNENGTLVEYSPDEENYFTDVASRKAVDFIQRASVDKTPFFLYLAPFAPHAPATAAIRHRELYPSVTAPVSPSFNEADVSDKPVNMSLNPLLEEKIISNINQNYRQRILSLQAVDEMIAELINTLEQTDQMENTYIVFTSDNGYHLGQHRLVEGKGTFYEEDIVVPFIVRGPGVSENRRVPGFLAGNVDIPITIADWAGIVPPDFVEGRSLSAVLANGTIPVENCRKAYLLETYAQKNNNEGSAPFERITAGLFNPTVGLPSLTLPPLEPISRGLRTTEYLYVEHSDSFVELYDLLNDPYELENIAPTASTTLLAHLSTWLQAFSECSGSGCLEVDMGLPK
ncbi:MAG: sulfatase [Chloroflexi bacterium]|nr:sulfatase [Chloroflexota bacterium]